MGVYRQTNACCLIILDGWGAQRGSGGLGYRSGKDALHGSPVPDMSECRVDHIR